MVLQHGLENKELNDFLRDGYLIRLGELSPAVVADLLQALETIE